MLSLTLDGRVAKGLRKLSKIPGMPFSMVFPLRPPRAFPRQGQKAQRPSFSYLDIKCLATPREIRLGPLSAAWALALAAGRAQRRGWGGGGRVVLSPQGTAPWPRGLSSPTCSSPAFCSLFTSYITTSSPSTAVSEQLGHFLCCATVGLKATCAWKGQCCHSPVSAPLPLQVRQ